MFAWFEALNLNELIFSLRNFVASNKILLPEWIVFSLPNGLWMYALVASMKIIWQQSESKIKYFWLFICLVIGLGGEIGQLFNWLPGVFDMLDLIIILVASFSPLVILNYKFREELIC